MKTILSFVIITLVVMCMYSFRSSDVKVDLNKIAIENVTDVGFEIGDTIKAKKEEMKEKEKCKGKKEEMKGEKKSKEVKKEAKPEAEAKEEEAVEAEAKEEEAVEEAAEEAEAEAAE